MQDHCAEVQHDIDQETNQFNTVEITRKQAKKKTTKHQDHSQYTTLGLIERFVMAVIRCKYIPDERELYEHIVYGHETYRTRLAHFYRSLNSMTRAYEEGYVYSPHVEAFFVACMKLNVLGSGFWWKFDLQYALPGDRDYVTMFHALLLEIKTCCQSREFLARIEAQERQVKDRVVDVELWEQRLFAWKSRHLMLHFTFKYRDQYRDELTVELMQAHWQKLLENKRMNQMLRGIENFVWRIEEGPKEGIHMHVIIAYDGRSHEGMSISGYICDYFEKITGDKGEAKAENFYAKSHEYRGQIDCTGTLNAHENERREALRAALRYLAKSIQDLRVKHHQKVRTFGMSQIPEHSGLGRPRVAASGYESITGASCGLSGISASSAHS